MCVIITGCGIPIQCLPFPLATHLCSHFILFQHCPCLTINQTDRFPSTGCHSSGGVHNGIWKRKKMGEKFPGSRITHEDCSLSLPGALPVSCFQSQRRNMWASLFLTMETMAWRSRGFQSQVVLRILQTSLRAHLSWLQSLALARRHRTRAAF